VKHLLIARLRDVEGAIEHLNVGGPGAIQRAMEAAMGSVFTTPKASRSAAKSPTVKRMFTTLWAIWAIFSAGQPVHDSIEGWGDTIQMLSSGSESQAKKRRRRYRPTQMVTMKIQSVLGEGARPLVGSLPPTDLRIAHGTTGSLDRQSRK
jgi:hypothetical protein